MNNQTINGNTLLRLEEAKKDIAKPRLNQLNLYLDCCSYLPLQDCQE